MKNYRPVMNYIIDLSDVPLACGFGTGAARRLVRQVLYASDYGCSIRFAGSHYQVVWCN